MMRAHPCALLAFLWKPDTAGSVFILSVAQGVEGRARRTGSKWKSAERETIIASFLPRRVPGAHAKRSAVARPVGVDRAARAADHAADRRGQSRRRRRRLRLYGAVDGASSRGGGREGRRARSGRDRLRRRGAQRRPRQRGHVGHAARYPEARSAWTTASALLALLGGAPARRVRAGRQARDRLRARAQRHAALRGRRRRPRRNRRARPAMGRARRAGPSARRRGNRGKRIGVGIYAGALLDTRAGTIQPLAYARGLARAAIAAGARISTAKPGARGSSETASAGWCARRKGRSPPTGWSSPPTPMHGRAVAAGCASVIPMPYFNFATRPLAEDLRNAILPERQGAGTRGGIMSYFRFDRSGRFLFGSVGALRGTGAAVHRAWVARAQEDVPADRPVEFEAQWYGMIGMTADALPRFHRLARNVVTFCGYNGRGIGPAPCSGACWRIMFAAGSAKRICRCRSPSRTRRRSRLCAKPTMRQARRSRTPSAGGCRLGVLGQHGMTDR